MTQMLSCMWYVKLSNHARFSMCLGDHGCHRNIESDLKEDETQQSRESLGHLGLSMGQGLHSGARGHYRAVTTSPRHTLTPQMNTWTNEDLLARAREAWDHQR